MVSYDPERSVSLYRESSKTFGGFDLSREDWGEVEFNKDYLTRSVEDIFPAENSSNYTFESNRDLDDLPASIILIEDNSGEKQCIIPFYVEKRETSVEYRGRDKFSVIKREPCEDRQYDKSTIDIKNGREVVAEEYEGKRDYYLYNSSIEDPVAYIPATYGSVTNVIELENGTVWASTLNAYFAPDSYLCELCGWSDLYLQRTV
jgi:hypothetical protein